jgi:hypothetical protein
MAIGTTTAVALMAAGSVISAASAIQQGDIAAKQANAQAALLQQQADREKQVAQAEEEDFRRKQSRAMASRRAILGGSGTQLDTGSNLMVSEDFAAENELQALRIRNSGDAAKQKLEAEAGLTRWAGQAAKRSSYVRAGGALLGGLGQSFSVYSARVPQKS